MTAQRETCKNINGEYHSRAEAELLICDRSIEARGVAEDDVVFPSEVANRTAANFNPLLKRQKSRVKFHSYP